MSEHPPSLENAEPPHQPPKRGWGWGCWGIVGLLLIFAGGSSVVLFFRVRQHQRDMRATQNVRDICIGLRSYAGEHQGDYPDGATANDALRELIKDGFFDDERCFTSDNSPYVGDDNVGEAPKYAKALEARENHWAMTKGLTDSSPGRWPLIFENPAVASWPPLWDSRFVNVAKPGRIRGGWTIMVGTNDGAIHVEPLTKDGRPLVTLEPLKDGKNLFELAGPHEVLDVAR